MLLRRELFMLGLDRLGQQILNGIADLVRVVNNDNEVVFVNDAMREILEDDIDKITCSFSHQNNFLCNLDITQRSIQTGEIIQREEIFEDFYFSVKTSPIWDEKGTIIGAVEVFRDNSREKKLKTELIEKNRTVTQELLQARNIQMSLLPERGSLKTVKIDYSFEPSDMISGDFLDVFQIDSENIGFYISDTVGHGFSSGMTTMFIRQTMRNLSTENLLVPSKALKEIHRRFLRLKLDLEIYFTMVYCVYNCKDKSLLFANAGHNCPGIVIQKEKILSFEIPGEPISSFFEQVNHEDQSIRVSCGDQILLFTDGLIESVNYTNESYGKENLFKVLRKRDTRVLDAINTDLAKFSWGDQIDDISMLLIDLC